jgi:alpha-L-rhamnosidase
MKSKSRFYLEWLKILLFCNLLLLPALCVFGKPAHSLTAGENFVNPLGFYDATPTFSWKLPGGVKKQTAYRIEARTGDQTWDSGWIVSDQSTFVGYVGKSFASRQRVDWRVNFRDEQGREAGWSKSAHFELGLLSSNDWKGQWISVMVLPDQPRRDHHVGAVE